MTSGSDDALATHELDLVTRASKGDAEAFDRFYERNAGGVQLLVERLLGPGPVADTVVLEAFEKTVRRLPLLGARNSSPRLYVLTTARNGAYAALGRDRPQAPKGPVAALLALPSRQRELLALRELGLSEAECAEVAGIEPAEVGVQIARGRLRLTDGLEEASLSGVFAEPRAERLLAAEVVRQDGTSLPPELEQETTQLADSDARFAAALSAVRSPSRSVGQLPPATGASRLAAIARDRIVLAGAAGGAAAALGSSAAQAAPAPAPPKPPARTSDPYDAQIGDEAAWGIVDDDDSDDPVPAPPAPPADGPEPTGAPSQEAWTAGTPQPAAPTPAAPSPGAQGAPAPSVPDDATAAAPIDDLAGWDTLDWDEDDKQWTAGPDAAPPAVAPVPSVEDPTVGAPIAAAPALPIDPEHTRPFDVVGAGLADPDDEAAVTSIAPGPPAGFDFGGGDTDEPAEEERRSPWRFLLWIVGFALLFAGVAFAAYTWKEARDNPDAPPASTIRPTTGTTPAQDDAPATSGSSKTESGSSKTSKSSSSAESSDTPRSTTSSSGSSSSGSSSSGSGSSGSSGGSSGGSGSSGSSGSSSGGSSTSQDRTVSGGEETSGGSVRGETGTTP